MAKLFLGGTYAQTKWREAIIPILEKNNLEYFNPVVPNWTPECIEEEHKQKDNECDVHLYCITSAMRGVFSIAEAVDSAWREDKKCVFIVIEDGFKYGQLKSLKATGDLIEKRGGNVIIVKTLKGLQKILKGNILKFIK